jgi:hypothetical protein
MNEFDVKGQFESSDSLEVNESSQIQESHQYLSISVTDTGVGMTEAKKCSCFKLNNGLTAAFLICKSLHGSCHVVRSKEGEGSKFQIFIKAKVCDLINLIDKQ